VFDRPSHPHTAALVAAVPPLSRGSGAIPRRRRTTGGQVMISAHDVVKSFRLRRRSVQTAPPVIRAVDGVSIDVRAGETFGIVGESGSGKTTLARLLVGLDRPDSGSITVDGIDVTASRRPAPLHRVAQMVFQDPMGSLDPRMTVDDIIAEPLRSLRVPGDHTQRVAELLEAVALPADSVHRYPHQFSGGQRQRIAIARALAPRPVVLVADEPVSALDMSVQTITLDLLAHLKEQFELTMVFISHDLSVVHEICDRVAVLEHGRVVEHGTVDDVFHNPADPYTRRLLSAIPRLDR
jgi:peptide/nickel transport system ATP-binding protein